MKTILSGGGVIGALAGTACGVPPVPFPAALDLSSVNGDSGFVINGIDANDNSGWSVSSAGDVNGDGYDDVIIGAPYAVPNGQSYAGESYVVFGGPGVGAGGAVNLSALNGADGFKINGIDANDHSGESVSSAGDVNGDGYDDLLIGADDADPGGRSNAGETYVVFGAPTVGAGGVVNLSALNGTNGFVINGIDANDYSGGSVSSAGDVNGDGYDDVIIGADGADPSNLSRAGESYVVFGGPSVGAGGAVNLSALNGTNGFKFNGDQSFDFSGDSVSSAGDFNGDGYDDLIIGAFAADPPGQSLAGETYVVLGGPSVGAGGTINVSALNGIIGIFIVGIDAGDNSGDSVSSAGDVNGDGYDDLLIGASGADPNNQSRAGESYVIFGGPDPVAGGVIFLSSLNGTNGFVINGIDAFDYAGLSVSSGGDVNGDGFDDVVIGANRADPNGQSFGGETYVVFGGPGVGAGGVVNLSALDGANGFTVNGVDSYDLSGASVSSAGDVNGDGVDDLIIGAWGADPNGQSYAGESYVVFGRQPDAPACAGDVNGDGFTNSADFNILAGNFGNAVAPNTSGDLTGDGVVNSADFNVLAGDFGCGS